MNLDRLAAALGRPYNGDGSLEISGLAGMENAGPHELTFLANPKYIHKVKKTHAGAILATADVTGPREDGGHLATILSPNPYHDFARALELFYQPPRPQPGIHPTAVIAQTAEIGAEASIGPYVVIGEHVRLGNNAVLHAHVVLYDGVEIGDDFLAHSHVVVREHCRIGHRVTLQNGVILGGDGFGFAKRDDGTHHKIPQAGITVLEDDVEVQSLTSIDRATLGQTRIARGTKVDSLVQIGHACVVGEDSIICGQVGLAGSTTVGKGALLAGQVGVAGHLTIGDGAVLYAQSGVGHDVEPGGIIAGSPAYDAREWRKTCAALPRLPDLLRTVRQLERRLQEMEQALAARAQHHE